MMMSDISYRLDADDVIASVSGDWEGFSAGNGARGLTVRKVVGRPLWDFIVDQSTRTLYADLMRTVRDEGRRIQFPYRCDSPTLKRFMTMTIEPLPDRGLAFGSVLRHVEERCRLEFRYVRSAPKLLTRCSLCGALKYNGEWTDVVDAVSQGLVLNCDEPILVAYGVCPGCMANVKAKAV